MIRAMVGQFIGVSKESFVEPKTVIFDSEDDFNQFVSQGHDYVLSKITRKNAFHIFDQYGIAREKTCSFICDVKNETIFNSYFQIGRLLTYKEVTGFVPLHPYFKDGAYEKFYTECIKTYFVEDFKWN